MVQRSAVRCCFNNYSRQPGVVTNMLEKLAWPSLEGKRKLSRLTMFHRVVNRNVDIKRDLYLTPISHTSRDGNSMLFLRPHSHSFFHTFFICHFYIYIYRDEWATTKQACRDESVVYLFLSSTNIYFALHNVYNARC